MNAGVCAGILMFGNLQAPYLRCLWTAR